MKFYDMSETTNYALVKDDANKVQLDNKTADADATELLTYEFKKIASVNTDLSIPAKYRLAPRAVQYKIRLDADYKTTDSADATFRQDDPIVAMLYIIHPVSGHINNAVIGQQVERLVSACKKEDGTWRFDDLMRSGLKPTED
jgi:hypothetical protein